MFIFWLYLLILEGLFEKGSRRPSVAQSPDLPPVEEEDGEDGSSAPQAAETVNTDFPAAVDSNPAPDEVCVLLAGSLIYTRAHRPIRACQMILHHAQAE